VAGIEFRETDQAGFWEEKWIPHARRPLEGRTFWGL